MGIVVGGLRDEGPVVVALSATRHDHETSDSSIPRRALGIAAVDIDIGLGVVISVKSREVLSVAIGAAVFGIETGLIAIGGISLFLHA